jgi:hypothetical protein
MELPHNARSAFHIVPYLEADTADVSGLLVRLLATLPLLLT